MEVGRRPGACQFTCRQEFISGVSRRAKWRAVVLGATARAEASPLPVRDTSWDSEDRSGTVYGHGESRRSRSGPSARRVAGNAVRAQRARENPSCVPSIKMSLAVDPAHSGERVIIRKRLLAVGTGSYCGGKRRGPELNKLFPALRAGRGTSSPAPRIRFMAHRNRAFPARAAVADEPLVREYCRNSARWFLCGTRCRARQ